MAVAHDITTTATGTSASTLTVSGVGHDVSAGRLGLVSVSTRSNVAVTSVDGPNGEVFALIKAQCGARAQDRIELWGGVYAAGAGTGDFEVTLASSATTVVGTAHTYTGEDTSTPTPTNVGYNTLGSGGACTGGTDNDDATGSLTTANNNSMIVAAFCTRNRTMTNTASWTNRVNDVAGGSGGDLITVSVEELLVAGAGATTLGAANNLSGTADWCLVAVEIKEEAAAGGQPIMRRLGRQPFRPVEIGRKSPGGVWFVGSPTTALARAT